jgi:hypothetical protein
MDRTIIAIQNHLSQVAQEFLKRRRTVKWAYRLGLVGFGSFTMVGSLGKHHMLHPLLHDILLIGLLVFTMGAWGLYYKLTRCPKCGVTFKGRDMDMTLSACPFCSVRYDR